MVKYDDAQLDAVFAALADPTRRAVLGELDGGTLAVSELAASHDMSLPGFMKHLRVLEDAGLIARSKEGRVVSCALSAKPMQKAADWIAHYEKFWTDKLDSLARYLYQQEEFQSWKQPVFRTSPRTSPRKSPRSTSGGTTRSRPRKSGGRGPTRKR